MQGVWIQSALQGEDEPVSLDICYSMEDRKSVVDGYCLCGVVAAGGNELAAAHCACVRQVRR